MNPDDAAELIKEHVQLLSAIQNVYQVLVLLIFGLVLLVGSMIVLAAYSVWRVNQQAERAQFRNREEFRQMMERSDQHLEQVIQLFARALRQLREDSGDH